MSTSKKKLVLNVRGVAKTSAFLLRRKKKLDILRIYAPIAASFLALTVFMSLVVITWRQMRMDGPVYEVEIATADEPVSELEEMPPEDEDMTFEEKAEDGIVEVNVEMEKLPLLDDVVPPLDCSSMLPEIPIPFHPETVALIKSPVMMKTISGSGRAHGSRLAALKKYGGTGKGEDAVIKGLRYLKGLQREDGSWKHKGEGDATAFALLAFLAHGEGFDSEEFGDTVKRALFYICEHHRSNMATYALVEAAGIIRTPILSELAAEAILEMCSRQKEHINANAGGVIPRYCAVMALVSAKLAGLKVDGMQETERKFLEAYLAMRDSKGGKFDKIKGEGVWHYMIDSVCLQYLGRGSDPNSHALLKYLDSVWEPATLGTTAIACCPVRSNYFATMMFFNNGGDEWEKWNAGMKAAYVNNQVVDGAMGWWECQDKHIGEQPFWPTCYILHQLMVYYRYLPTYTETAWGKSVAKQEIDYLKGFEVEVSFE